MLKRKEELKLGTQQQNQVSFYTLSVPREDGTRAF